tara:strand:- start:269 stop:718 length:450 start_codon:yes stop_codon:yes gene_type:complete
MSKFVGLGYNLLKNIIKGGKQKTTGEAIKSVKPAVHKSKGAQKLAETYINIGKQRGKMKRSFQKMEEDIDPARTKLRQTTQKIAGEKVTDSGISKGKDRIKKMGGGFMGKRMSYKKGSKFPDLTGDGKVTFADILKGRGVINGKKKGKK